MEVFKKLRNFLKLIPSAPLYDELKVKENVHKRVLKTKAVLLILYAC
jgi:hypothetical protein